MPAVANLVHEISTTTGTGDITTSSVNGKQDFAEAFGTGSTPDVFTYFISSRDADEWEVGTGHMSASTTLVRDTVLEGTNGTSPVDFSAGTKDITNDIPAGKQVSSDELASVATSGSYSDLSGTPTLSSVATSGDYDDLTDKPTLGTAAAQDVGYFATAAQGALADSAVQPGDLGTAAAADTGDFATAAQGALADSATQPGDLATVATTGSYDDLTDKPSLYRNRTINPQLFWAQAGVGSTTDGNYTGIDQWYALTQTAAVTSSQLTDVANGLPSMGRLTQSQSTAQRMGWAQVFESSLVKDLRGKTVTLAAKVRMSAAATLRYAIIEWTGTADAVTKDVVASWTNTTFTAGQFFSGTSLTVAATGSIALATSTLTDVMLAASISSSMNNIIIFFWTDSTQAQTITLDIGNVFFGQGATAPQSFDPLDPASDFRACLRYYRIFTAPALGSYLCLGWVRSSTVVRGIIDFPVIMRAAPSVSVSSVSDFQFLSSSTLSFSAFSGGTSTPDNFQCEFATSGGSAGQSGAINATSTSAKMFFDARL